jgi:dihydroflavonol-4-reductase
LSTKVFITGGTGFLGAYIIKELVEKSYSVRALRRTNKLPSFIEPSVFEKVEWVNGDVLDISALEDAMTGIDMVIHSAAKISFLEKERYAMFKTNVDGTANVVNTALLKNVKRLVYVSSVAALGRTINGDKVNEDKKWEDSKMNTNYAISKYQAEMELWRAIGEGLNAVIVNPSTILGYGDWNTGSSAIFKNVYNEFPWYTNGVNGFVDVEDVARATVLLMETEIENQRFILNGDNWSFRKLFNTIADGFNKKHPTKEASSFLAEIAWRLEKIKSIFSGKDPLLTKESARVAQTKTYFDTAKILSALNNFRFTPLEETIENACKKYLLHSERV